MRVGTRRNKETLQVLCGWSWTTRGGRVWQDGLSEEDKWLRSCDHCKVPAAEVSSGPGGLKLDFENSLVDFWPKEAQIRRWPFLPTTPRVWALIFAWSDASLRGGGRNAPNAKVTHRVRVHPVMQTRPLYTFLFFLTNCFMSLAAPCVSWRVGNSEQSKTLVVYLWISFSVCVDVWKFWTETHFQEY